jgi:hypothetical protein
VPLAITTYQWLLAGHILCAVIWVGGALTTQLYALRAQTAGPARIAEFSGDIAWLGPRLFIPSSLLLVIFGFLLIREGHWDYEAWVVIALIVWGASFVTGATFLGPQSGKVNEVSEEYGPESDQVQRRLSRVFLVSRIELVFLILIVLDMTLKPGA